MGSICNSGALEENRDRYGDHLQSGKGWEKVSSFCPTEMQVPSVVPFVMPWLIFQIFVLRKSAPCKLPFVAPFVMPWLTFQTFVLAGAPRPRAGTGTRSGSYSTGSSVGHTILKVSPRITPWVLPTVIFSRSNSFPSLCGPTRKSARKKTGHKKRRHTRCHTRYHTKYRTRKKKKRKQISNSFLESKNIS